MSVTLEFAPAADTLPGVVAYVRLPLACRSMKAMNTFIRLAYGPDCMAAFDPPGWIRITKPEDRRAET